MRLTAAVLCMTTWLQTAQASEWIEAYPWWTGASIDEFAAGRFNDDLAADLFVRSDGKVIYHESIGGLTLAAIAIPAGAIDIATLPAGLADRDGLVVSTATGLKLLLRDLSTQPSFTVIDLQQPSFANRRLKTVTYNGLPIVVGIGSGGLVLLDGVSLTLIGEINLSGTIHDVDAMNWDGSGSDELMVLINERLDIVDLAGASQGTSIHGFGGGTVAVSKGVVGDRDLALWQTSVGEGTRLTVAHSGGSAVQNFTESTGSLLSFRHDLDSRVDFVRLPSLPGQEVSEVWLRIGSGTTIPSFASLFAAVDPGGAFTVGAGCGHLHGNETLKAAIAFDADLDGDIDLALGIDAPSKSLFRLLSNQVRDEETLRLNWAPQEDVSQDGGVETTLVSFLPPSDPTSFANATHLRLRMLVQNSSNEARVIPNGWTDNFLPINPASASFLVTFALPVSSLLPTRLYEVTAVTLDSTNQITAQSPANVLLYVPDPIVYEVVASTLPGGCTGADPGDGCGLLNGGRGGCGSSTPPPP